MATRIRHSNPADPARLLVVVRHAHRVRLEGGAADNGLSPKGKKQAKRITARYRECFGKQKPRLLSSPKKRCRETIEGIARLTGAEIELDSSLDEGGKIHERARKFVTDWRASDSELTVICSHGDLIPLLMEELTGARVELDKGGWAEIDEGSGLRWLLQTL